MTGYLDSSVVLRWLLNNKYQFQNIKKYSKFISSELLIIECNRVLERYRLENLLKDEELSQTKSNFNRILNGIDLIEINGPVKKRASESFPTIIGTLDSIHMSTALLYKEERNIHNLYLITHDRQLANCAIALGIEIEGSSERPPADL